MINYLRKKVSRQPKGTKHNELWKVDFETNWSSNTFHNPGIAKTLKEKGRVEGE